MERLYIQKADRTLKHIRQMRAELGLTQNEIANKLGVSQNAYSKFELGYTVIKLEQLYGIADIFGVSITELIIP